MVEKIVRIYIGWLFFLMAAIVIAGIVVIILEC